MSDVHNSVDTGASHGSLKSYVVGLVISIALTLVAFGVVMMGDFSHLLRVIVVTVTAIIQVLVQLILFMHLNTKDEDGWNFMSFVFTVAVLVLLVGGSLWIMHHLHANMMMG
ncbi:cytochrome o ubiquinol oxidase subunit IV [Salinicola aestuarinus]|uniref:cytochrome o ubiquinol oxidase subunit IV n=1 Tax=Salinicola aestuarinus TaxID=1949082 RepID=UPI000DA241EC|nr:cytochrome o ubiquinol oxidase subunit IV [Salinicola aestuarinus]